MAGLQLAHVLSSALLLTIAGLSNGSPMISQGQTVDGTDFDMRVLSRESIEAMARVATSLKEVQILELRSSCGRRCGNKLEKTIMALPKPWNCEGDKTKAENGSKRRKNVKHLSAVRMFAVACKIAGKTSKEVGEKLQMMFPNEIKAQTDNEEVLLPPGESPLQSDKNADKLMQLRKLRRVQTKNGKSKPKLPFSERAATSEKTTWDAWHLDRIDQEEPVRSKVTDFLYGDDISSAVCS